MSNLFIFTDGGSRGNPGPAALGVYVSDDQGQVIFEEGRYLGTFTNNEAEYDAFMASLVWLTTEGIKLKPEKIVWQLDSKLVVEQLNKNWKIKEDRLRLKAQAIWQLLATLTVPYTISHVLREKNKEADRLVNQALDAQLA